MGDGSGPRDPVGRFATSGPKDGAAPIFPRSADGLTRICYNAVHRQVDPGRADQAALIWDSTATELEFTTAFAALEDHASVWRVRWPQGGATGDRVNQYMPMVPGAIVDMLACARIGAIHSVVTAGMPRRNWRTARSQTPCCWTEPAK